MFHIPVNDNLKVTIEHVGSGIFHLIMGTPQDTTEVKFGELTIDQLVLLGLRLVDLRNNPQFQQMLQPEKILSLIEKATLDGSLVPIDNENKPNSSPVPTEEAPANATS